ncbi:uncharacterized protein LOC129582235 [Paramacrobiotus metropolitanus]|uniref:uncharacterized protein LOC129582235 n=1 Tax=Paramacrobiotus metropolitanus TaxID=2943436 RepID=UPI002445C5FD|nr:uncharacterized protein LOC129582235 [Paramacrobiotus metropolitanus]
MVHMEMELAPHHKHHHHSGENTTIHLRDALKDEHSEKEYDQIHRLFRPVMIVLGLLGLWHPSPRECSDDIPERYRFSRAARWFFIFCSVCNFSFTLANFIMLLVAHPATQMRHLTYNVYIILTVWSAYACVLSMLHFRICEKGWLFEMWELWVYWARLPRYRNWDRMKNVRNLYLIVAAAVTIAPTVIVGVGQGGAHPGEFLEKSVLRTLEKSTPALDHILFSIDLTALTFIMYGTAAFTTAFFLTQCLIVREELCALYEMIEEKLDTGKVWNNVREHDEEISVLEQLRRRRLECRNMVEAMDKTFEHTAFLSIFANVPLIVFIAYAIMVHPHANIFVHGLCVIALLLSLFQVFAVSIGAAWINKWADAPKRLLHTLKIHNYLKMTRPNQASLSLFLSELTSESLGITAWELTIITKEFVATVIGLAVSYIIVLYEFGHMNELIDKTEEISHRLRNLTALTVGESGLEMSEGGETE